MFIEEQGNVNRFIVRADSDDTSEGVENQLGFSTEASSLDFVPLSGTLLGTPFESKDKFYGKI